MRITDELRKHMQDKLNLPADADDAAVQVAVAKALEDGTLEPETLAELTRKPKPEEVVGKMVDERISKALGPISEKLDKMVETMAAAPKEPVAEPKAAPVQPKEGEPSDAQKAMAAGATAANAPRVKSVSEQYSATTTAATWDKSCKEHLRKAFGGRQLRSGEGPGGRLLDMPSERGLAVTGAWFKMLLNRAYRNAGRAIPPHARLTDLDQKLCEYAAHEVPFVGPIDFNDATGDAKHWYTGQVLSDFHRKAVLDDAVSGGVAAVPVYFDDAAIITPLLTGELFPYVALRNVTRRRIEGFGIGNPTLQWGAQEGTQISLFDTDGFITAFDTTVNPVTGALEVGIDMQEDSPVGIGELIVDRYGDRFRNEMDRVLAVGTGVDQPLGVFNTPGVAVVPTDNGNVGPPTVSDYEGLLFGVAKEYRQEARGTNAACFLGNEASYRRSKGIAVGATDQRRVFGMDHEDYQLLGYRFGIIHQVPNSDVGFFCLNRYRLYRRQGFEVRVVTEDKELALRNQHLVIVRARFGGKMELSGAGAISNDAQA